MTAEPARLRTLIVDDEPLAAERIQSLCEAIPLVEIIGVANNGVVALEMVGELEPDLLLLDISMPEMDGMTLARALRRQREKGLQVIFVTAHDSFAVEAFDLPASDYLLKPVAPERLARAVERAAAKRAEADPSSAPAVPDGDAPVEEFWVPHRSELIRITADAIDRVDAERDYMRLHVGQRSYLLHQTIAALEARLDPQRFIRLHRSVIVRKDRIKGLCHDRAGAWFADLVDGEQVRIGRTFLARVKAMAGR